MARKTIKKTLEQSTPRNRRGALPPLKMTPELLADVRKFQMLISAGYSDENWDDAVYLLSKINMEAPLGVVEKLGAVWAEAYVDTSRVHDKVDAILQEHFPSA